MYLALAIIARYRQTALQLGIYKDELPYGEKIDELFIHQKAFFLLFRINALYFCKLLEINLILLSIYLILRYIYLFVSFIFLFIYYLLHAVHIHTVPNLADFFMLLTFAANT